MAKGDADKVFRDLGTLTIGYGYNFKKLFHLDCNLGG